MSNMLYHCMPAFCGADNTDRFLKSFVELMRLRTEEKVTEFYDAGAEMVAASTNKDFCQHLYPLTERRLFHDWFDGIGEHALDPAIPALFQHIAIWGARKDERFRVIHDQSKPVLATTRQFEQMMAQGEEASKSIGYDRRKFRFPLRATALEQGNSRNYPQLQIADICGGAMTHFLKSREAGELDDVATLFRDLCMAWVADAVIPGVGVSPEELGTDSDNGTNPIDPIVAYVQSRGD